MDAEILCRIVIAYFHKKGDKDWLVRLSPFAFLPPGAPSQSIASENVIIKLAY